MSPHVETVEQGGLSQAFPSPGPFLRGGSAVFIYLWSPFEVQAFLDLMAPARGRKMDSFRIKQTQV